MHCTYIPRRVAGRRDFLLYGGGKTIYRRYQVVGKPVHKSFDRQTGKPRTSVYKCFDKSNSHTVRVSNRCVVIVVIAGRSE